MSYRYMKHFVVALIASASLRAATAGADTVAVTGGTNLTLAGTTGARLINHTGSQTFACTTAAATATVNASTVGSFPLRIGTNLTPTFTSCTFAGGFPITVKCGPAHLDVGAPTVAGATSGQILKVMCDIRLGNGTTSTCHVTTDVGGAGSTAGLTYINSTHTLTLDQDHMQMAITGSPAGCVFKNSTSMRIQSSPGGNMAFAASPAVSISAS
jgi:hypothetical protein